MKGKVNAWTNASVRLLAGQDDPVEVVLKRAREIVLQAMDQGWSGPPFDPIALSGLLKNPRRAACRHPRCPNRSTR